ncbi:MAG: HAD-IA family hydrolase [Gammaproteobacteria bacterium]|nr:HAD-IA family hydrolase [Gammaproteobacteria bacterium]MYD76179.1 HAD-IA family hydrolase [Gammaproteobacteria bacterium]MYJ53145.1 HAD-IA family hydrolase [Gammaproteobacteria bacterium]
MTGSPLPCINAVLFDLDGTLLDTHGDLCNALNRIEKSCGKPPTPHRALRPYVSQGAMKMICMAFGYEPDNPKAKSLWQEMIRLYGDDIASLTVPFPGIRESLEYLSRNNIEWGIVTNKPERLSRLLLDTLEFDPSPRCIVGGDTLTTKKPDPAPLLHACRALRTNPSEAVYVGDDERDVIAGRCAGMATVAVRYGYHPPDNPPDSWGADRVIDHASELIALLADARRCR